MTYPINIHSQTDSSNDSILAKLSFWFSHALGIVHSWNETSKLHKSERVAIRELLNLNDEQLRDIGLTRGDIAFACKHSNGEPVTKVLQRIAHGDQKANAGNSKNHEGD